MSYPTVSISSSLHLLPSIVFLFLHCFAWSFPIVVFLLLLSLPKLSFLSWMIKFLFQIQPCPPFLSQSYKGSYIPCPVTSWYHAILLTSYDRFFLYIIMLMPCSHDPSTGLGLPIRTALSIWFCGTFIWWVILLCSHSNCCLMELMCTNLMIPAMMHSPIWR